MRESCNFLRKRRKPSFSISGRRAGNLRGMKLSPIFSAIALMGTLGVAPLMGQTILAEYKFNGGSLAASDVDSSVTATALVSGKTGIVNGTANANNLYYFLKNSSGVELPHSQADALADTAYVSMTLGAVDDPVTLGSMTFDFGNHGTAFTMDAYAFATVTIGGTTTVYTATIYDTVTETTAAYYAGRTGAGPTDTLGRATIDFGGLEVESTAEIRLYTWYDNLQRPSGTGGLPSGSAYSLRVDNIALSTQAIPEAGTVALLLAGVAGVALWRREW